MLKYIKEIVRGAWSLIEGMQVTLRHLIKPVVTVQYPRKRLKMSPAFRGPISLRKFEETGAHKCIVCGNCEKICPSGVITVKGTKTEQKGPKTLTYYVIDFTKCSLCGLCVESCPTKTLEFSKRYEICGGSRQDGVFDLLDKVERPEAH